VLLLALVAALVACGPTKDTSRFFVLTAAEKQAEGARAPRTLGLGPIEIPDYLDRPELIERVAPTEVRVQGSARWAAPLPEVLASTLAEDLEAQLATRVVAYPWDPTEPPPLAVEVKLRRFERQAGGPVELRADWTVVDGETLAPIRTGSVHITEPVIAPDPRATVAGLSRALDKLSVAIARDVEAVATRRRGEARP
jgi:uncharacterized lipoprotein YmbA